MVKIALMGDVFITRSLPQKEYEGFLELAELLEEYEVKFANLETTVHRREGYPSAFPGGTWAMADPNCLKDLKKYGINVLNTANNHSMDYSHSGLLATQKYLADNNLLYAGTGENLADAAAPAFIECSEARVAMIGATSSFHDSDAAGNQHGDMNGRPGVNPLRHKSVYEVTEENFKSLKKIAEELRINEYHDQAIKEGYLLPRENFSFSNLEFIAGQRDVLHTYPLEKDIERVARSIKGAKKQSDYVIVSIHSHQFSDGDKKNPAEFIRIFAKYCVDAGASIVVGHGPHLVRGIEIYKNSAILYGLGNFIFQNETISHLPADFYEKYSSHPDDGIGAAMEKRSKNGTIGLAHDKYAWESVLAGVEIDENVMRMRLFPLELGYELPQHRRGFPRLSRNHGIIERIRDLSLTFGAEVEIADGIGSVVIHLK